MKRFHVHAHVEDLPASIAFYSRLFAAEPTRVEADYAKWMLDDPRINFAISNRGGKPGVDHLGIQVDSEAELAEMKERARRADMALLAEGEVSCCYARSDKYWLTDPQGVAWEQFHTLDSIPVFGRPVADAQATEPSGRSPAAATCCAAKAAPSPANMVPAKASSACC